MQRFQLRVGVIALVFATVALSVAYLDWPPNRDVTTYAVIARELLLGQRLYVDVWDLKPPAIFATYMLAEAALGERWLFVALDVIPTLIVLGVLLRATAAAGFGLSGGLISASIWAVLSADQPLQMYDPNTEIFINACSSAAFLLLLQLRVRNSQGSAVPLAVGCLFAIACLYKTVAIAIAMAVGLAWLLPGVAAVSLKWKLQSLVLMSLSGAVSLCAVLGYFTLTGRYSVFREAMVDAGSNYAGNLAQNIVDGLTLAPIAGDSFALKLIIAIAPWLGIALLARVDHRRKGAWLLLGGYGLGSLIAVGLPGAFYAHYFQLLVPPFCLGVGWLAAIGLKGPKSIRRLTLVSAAVVLIGLAFYETRPYRVTPEQALTGTYQGLYLVTKRLGLRLGSALTSDEVLYQWGEESGLYWYSDKRPPASVLTFPLLSGPQAARLTAQTRGALLARPPDLIVVADYMRNASRGHPVFEWVGANYTAVEPQNPAEAQHFTLYIPKGASREFLERVR
jgi:hypothetical protein